MSLYTQVLEPWLTQPIILRGSSNPVMPSASTTGNSAPVETISFASGSKQPNVFEGLLYQPDRFPSPTDADFETEEGLNKVFAQAVINDIRHQLDEAKMQLDEVKKQLQESQQREAALLARLQMSQQSETALLAQLQMSQQRETASFLQMQLLIESQEVLDNELRNVKLPNGTLGDLFPQS